MAAAVVTIQDDELRALCSRLNAAALSADDRRELLSGIGAEMETQTQERCQTKTTPAGDDWKALAKSTQEHYLKKFGSRNPFRGLLWRNSPVPLRDTVTSEVENWSVLVGATAVYAAVHQWGYKKIPARQYLGLGSADRADILGIVELFLEKKMEKGV